LEKADQDYLRPRIISAAFSAIMMTGALMFPPTKFGITEASATRSPLIPKRATGRRPPP
jgi:hypothetical protein